MPKSSRIVWESNNNNKKNNKIERDRLKRLKQSKLKYKPMLNKKGMIIRKIVLSIESENDDEEDED